MLRKRRIWAAGLLALYVCCAGARAKDLIDCVKPQDSTTAYIDLGAYAGPVVLYGLCEQPAPGPQNITLACKNPRGCQCAIPKDYLLKGQPVIKGCYKLAFSGQVDGPGCSDFSGCVALGTDAEGRLLLGVADSFLAANLSTDGFALKLNPAALKPVKVRLNGRKATWGLEHWDERSRIGDPETTTLLIVGVHNLFQTTILDGDVQGGVLMQVDEGGRVWLSEFAGAPVTVRPQPSDTIDFLPAAP